MSVAVNEILSLSFKGRASRGAYWRTLAALAVLAAAGGLALDSLSGLAGGGAAQKGLDLLIWGWLLFLAAFLVSAVVRRLHDISYGAVAAVFLIVPGLQIIVLVILGLMPGKKGLNRFGPDPLAVMTVRDAAPVRRTERSDTVRCPAREVRETLEGEVVEPGPDLEGTIIRERMSAEAEDWASDLIAGAKARMEASPESREGEVAAVRAGLVAARNEGVSPSLRSCDGCRSSRGSEAGHHALEQARHGILPAVPKREEALRPGDDGRASGGAFSLAHDQSDSRRRVHQRRDADVDRPLRLSSPHQSHSYLHDRVRGAQAARCRSFGGLGTVRDVSGRKYFSDAVPAAAPRRLTANGLETSGRGGC